MRASLSVGVLLLVLAPVYPAVADPIAEPQAMIYFQAHWSGRPRDEQSSLGFRLDRSALIEHGFSDFQRQIQLPAMLELRVGEEGIQALNVAGTDYLDWYRMNRADEAPAADNPDAKAAPAGDQGPAGKSTDQTPGAAPAPASKEAASQPAPAEQKKLTVGGILEAAPVGVIMGVGLGVFLLTGAGH